MRKPVARIAVAVALAASVATNIAHASPRPAEPVTQWFAAKVVCAHPAEDSLGHLRLEVFEHNPNGSYTLVYQCMRHGY